MQKIAEGFSPLLLSPRTPVALAIGILLLPVGRDHEEADEPRVRHAREALREEVRAVVLAGDVVDRDQARGDGAAHGVVGDELVPRLQRGGLERRRLNTHFSAAASLFFDFEFKFFKISTAALFSLLQVLIEL